MDIKNKRKFFQNIKLDDEGRVVVFLDTKIDPIEKGKNEYNTYNKLIITQEGYLKIAK